MRQHDIEQPAWQAEADLLADGRDLLERMCSTTRYRHLFPRGGNPALLLQAYQELDRIRTVARETRNSTRKNGRRLRRLLARAVRNDALSRNRRLTHGFPPTRTQRLDLTLPDVVLRALTQVDADARREVEERLTGRDEEEWSPSASASLANLARVDRGLGQFREALTNTALANPGEIRKLHPQFIAFASSPPPHKKRHPIATLLLVRLPLQFVLWSLTLFSVAYFAAYSQFNDARLAAFLTQRISGHLDGELAFERVHWQPRLVFDFLSGQPTPVETRGVRVYAPFKSAGRTRDDAELAAYAEHLSLGIVLHEIIPWNRLGVIPAWLEIPWVLHFSAARNRGPMWIRAADMSSQGQLLNTLTDAFSQFPAIPRPAGMRGLSVRVDGARFSGVSVGLYLIESQNWETELRFDVIRGDLEYLGQHADDSEPPRLPLRYRLTADGGRGPIRIPSVLDRPIDAVALRLDPLENGWNRTPVGDMRIAGAAKLAGSPVTYDGFLRDVFGEGTTVNFKLATTDAGPIADLVWAPDPAVPQHEQPMIEAAGAAAKLTLEGPVSDPSLRIVAQGITMDLFDDAAWALDDVDLAFSLARDVVPEMWEEKRPRTSSGEVDERWILYPETFRGAALDGEIRLHRRGGLDHIVLDDEEVERDPLLVSLFVDLDHVNPAQLVPDFGEFAPSLRGSASGSVELHKLVLHEEDETTIVDHANLYLHKFRIRRDRGPRDDGLPKMLSADGALVYSDRGGLDLRGLRVGTEGGELSASGGIEPDRMSMKPTNLRLRVREGPAFLHAFGLGPYFETLAAELDLHGSMGAPSSEAGVLSVTGARGGDLTLDGLRDARLWFDRGTLFIRSPRAEFLGGYGPLELDLVLFERGRLLDDPRLRVLLELEGVDSDDLLGTSVSAHGAALQLYIDDGNNQPVPLSRFQARGAAYAPRLDIAGTTYHDADARFRFADAEIQIERLSLAYHRQISPLHAPGVAVEVGSLTASGAIGVQDDPRLNLEVKAQGLPLAAITRLAGLDQQIRGHIASGTAFSVGGTANRPEVHGQLRLVAISTAGIPLGSGSLAVSTERHDTSEGGNPSHRTLRIQGRLGDRKDLGPRSLAWEIDANLAFPESVRGKTPPIEMDFALHFTRLPLDALLAHPSRAHWRRDVRGQLRDLEVRTQYCPAGNAGLLAACGNETDRSLKVSARLGDIWIGPPEAAALANPCLHAASLCSENALRVDIDAPTIQMTSPWRVRTGGATPAIATISGTFDLTTGSDSDENEVDCNEQDTWVGPREGRGRAEIKGDFELSALGPWLRGYGVRGVEGSLKLSLDVDGQLRSPALRGTLATPSDDRRLRLTVAMDDDAGEDTQRPSSAPIPLEFSALKIAVRDGIAALEGSAQVFRDRLEFGRIGDVSTRIAIGGACRGHFTLAATGILDGSLPHALLPDWIRASSGSMSLSKLVLAGDVEHLSGGALSALDVLDAEIRFGRQVTRIGLADQKISIRRGVLQARLCSPDEPCDERTDHSLALFLGGERGAYALSRPRDALEIGLSDRGTASSWGVLILPPALDTFTEATLHASLAGVRVLKQDHAGRPELEATLSSERVTLEADATGSLSVRGDVLVERSRWFRDATQGVAILSFTDPVPAPPSTLPTPLRDLRLDLNLKTTSPFQVDNNVLKRLEGQAKLRLGGTLADPEVTGFLEVERGRLDVAILGDEYIVDHGRVTIERELSESYVDVIAVSQEPVRIENQLHYITVHLSGALDEIHWECSAIGDTSRQLGTARGCVDYVIFDAGNVDAAGQGVGRSTSSPLLYTGKPLALVSKLLELQVNTYLEREIPRTEDLLPEMWVRAGHLGLEAELHGRPQWLQWSWGSVGFEFEYLRGYPGSLLRDSMSYTVRIELLDDTAIESGFGKRNYSNRVLVLDPAEYKSIELVRSLEIPSIR
ncbi:MAG: translocation/assembly module TamB domain-containing protein [Nannocystaceae bacterium]